MTYPQDATSEELTESLNCLSIAFGQVLSDQDALAHFEQLTEMFIEDEGVSDRVASIIRFHVNLLNTLN
ncbi:MAG: hypothetical protein F4Z35_06770 [Dehalococcoidia bacterium]|nr:hypothetical protein [Dehalococcoidia bacterium]